MRRVLTVAATGRSLPKTLVRGTSEKPHAEPREWLRWKIGTAMRLSHYRPNDHGGWDEPSGLVRILRASRHALAVVLPVEENDAIQGDRHLQFAPAHHGNFQRSICEISRRRMNFLA